MGCDFQYQGYPPESDLIELVRSLAETDFELADAVLHVPFLLAHGRQAPNGEYLLPKPRLEGWVRYPQEKRVDPVWAWCCRVTALNPKIRERQFSFGDLSHARAMHFMLSAKERRSARWPKPAKSDPRSWNDPIRGFDDIIGQAFFDAEPVHDDVYGNKGHLVRHITKQDVSDIGICLEALDFEEIEPHLREGLALAERCLAQGEVPQPSFGLSFDQHRDQFEAFKKFFAEAAQNGEAVLIVCT